MTKRVKQCVRCGEWFPSEMAETLVVESHWVSRYSSIEAHEQTDKSVVMCKDCVKQVFDKLTSPLTKLEG